MNADGKHHDRDRSCPRPTGVQLGMSTRATLSGDATIDSLSTTTPANGTAPKTLGPYKVER